jgi:uracil phosphoribosyltransferase
MRDKDTSTASFRKLLREISLLLAYEVTRELPMTTKRIETPLEEMDAPASRARSWRWSASCGRATGFWTGYWS